MGYQDDYRRNPRDDFRQGDEFGQRSGSRDYDPYGQQQARNYDQFRQGQRFSGNYGPSTQAGNRQELRDYRGAPNRPSSYQGGGEGHYQGGSQRDFIRDQNTELYGRERMPFTDPSVIGSSQDVDDYAFFNAGNYGRHYGAGFSTAQPMEPEFRDEFRWQPPSFREAEFRRSPNEWQNRQPINDISHRGRGPKGYTRADSRILEDIHDRLTDDHYLDASNIEVVVNNSEATLNGTVNTRQEKRRAEDLAEQVSGITHVQNNLRVQDMRQHSTWERGQEGIQQAASLLNNTDKNRR